MAWPPENPAEWEAEARVKGKKKTTFKTVPAAINSEMTCPNCGETMFLAHPETPHIHAVYSCPGCRHEETL